MLFDSNWQTLVAYPAGKTEEKYTVMDSVQTIAENAFTGCDNLFSVTIGTGIQSIGEDVFSNCRDLKSIIISAETHLVFGSEAFRTNGFGLMFYVPASTVEAYKTASGWSTYASAIVSQ